MKKMRAWAAVCLVLLVLLGASVGALAADAPAGEEMDTRTLALVNKPGVVLVYTTWTAEMSMREFYIEDALYDDIEYEIVRAVLQGEMGSSDAEIVTAFIDLFTRNMASYTQYTGRVNTQNVSTGGIGTGFIVTPDGYLVTNSHVVEQDQEELYYSFVLDNLSAMVMEALELMEGAVNSMGYTLTDTEAELFSREYSTMLAQSFELSDIVSSTECFMGQAAGGDVSVKARAMEVKKMGEPLPGKDVAILKVEGSNLPTVTMGDDTDVKTGDAVYAFGYPALATVNAPVVLEHSMQEPTLTQGIISAKKQMTGGWEVFQMDAAIHGGNSGGPLLNSKGEVIGINTFGMADENGVAADGLNFAIPVSIAKEFLQELNITPSESEFTASLRSALGSYNQGDYAEAADKLRTLNETDPGYPVVQEMLADARAKAEKAEAERLAQQEARRKAMMPFIIVGVVVVVALAAVVVLVVLRNKKRAAAKAAGPQGVGGAAYGQPGMPPAEGWAPYQAVPPAQPAAPPYQDPRQMPLGTMPPAQYGMPQAGEPVPPAPPPFSPPAPYPAEQAPPPDYAVQPDAPVTPAEAPPAAPAPEAQSAGANAPEQGLHCTQCGSSLRAGAKFCNNCGAKTP